MKKYYLKATIKTFNVFDKYQSVVTFLIVLIVIFLIDSVLYQFLPFEKIAFLKDISESGTNISTDFAPEVWIGLLSLVLGTLIIVISIASQSTPKLIDLYIKDQKSLLYIWFIAAAGTHNMWLQFYYSAGDQARATSALFNTYILLPLGLLFAIPYILYILKYTKTSNVIQKIHNQNFRRIKRLPALSQRALFDSKRYTSNYQLKLLEAMNQLDDLLEYVAFKEPKGDIINKIGKSVRTYISLKKNIKPSFFQITNEIKDDISFKTMTSQFEELETSRAFYEVKAFRLLGNAYLRLIEKNDFDLASLCVHELSEIGNAAVQVKDDKLINLTLIRFNTFLRFGIKHGVRNSEVRNVYNAIFHYSQFIEQIITSKSHHYIKQSCSYIKTYGTEVYKHSQKEIAFAFLVDVFALELKKILILLNKEKFETDFQEDILNLFLQMDNPPDLDRDEIGQARIKNDGVRILQIGLCLYYLSVGAKNLAEPIIDDILEDFKSLKEDLKIAVEATCTKLKIFGPTFWEDTDRGNSNLYYAEDKEFIPQFLDMFNAKYQKLIS